MWNFFRKRQHDDFQRLVTAYRCFLKAADQAEEDNLDSDSRSDRKWRGGFGKAYNQLLKRWPTPNEMAGFEKKMVRNFRKDKNMEHAFIHAFNEFLEQKRLNPRELTEVMELVRKLHGN